MSPVQRAAQFAPFAALTGYDAACRETARLTEPRRTLDETRQEEINGRLCLAAESGKVMAFTWFVPDAHKDGGAYVTRLGTIRRIEPVSATIFLTDGTTIPVKELWQVQEPE